MKTINKSLLLGAAYLLPVWMRAQSYSIGWYKVPGGGDTNSIGGARNRVLSRRAYVRVDAACRAIPPGDFRTTSTMPGRAMKVTDHARAEGAILGKAMTGLKKGRGMMPVTLQ